MVFNISRRDFLKKAGIATAATTFLPSQFPKATDIKTGLALYTVRDEMMKDPDGTLSAIARTGYNWVEAANYSNGLFYNQKPAVFRKKVDSFGLKLISSHCSFSSENIDKIVSDTIEAGISYLVLPSLPVFWRRTLNGYKEAAGFFNRAGEKCIKAGIKFVYHNHRNEFKGNGNQIPYDLLLQNTDPELVTFELDLCWITAAGKSAVEYINKYPGRFELFHMKDMSANKKDATLGEGIIDFKPVFALTGKAGMKYFFVEQDSCKTHTPLESIKISRDYLLNSL
jgi:sugar phosphate isomerase/epimerase